MNHTDYKKLLYYGSFNKQYLGSTYEGEFKCGKFHGQGTFICNGWTYVGALKNGLFEGKGKCTYKNAGFYDGQWLNHKANGEGFR